jgi:hypothetical protein
MSHRAVLLSMSMLLFATGCAEGGQGGDQAAAPASPSGDLDTVFAARAEQVARQWRAAGTSDAWGTGFVPLQALTVPPAGVTFSDATKRAFAAGWYRLETGMPREAGGRKGTITYAGGATETVPVITLAEAYAELDQGDPPPCPGPTVPPPADAPGPDGTDGGGPESPASDKAPKSCVALTITGATLGSVKILTSRGETDAPAWLFTVRELKGPVARVAVAPSAIATVPEIDTDGLPPGTGLVAAQDLTSVTGTRLAFRLGVGACDEQIRPLAFETEDVVVVGGTATRRDGVCTEQLLLHPVTVELDEPSGARPVIDAATARVLTISAVPGD